MSSDNEKFCRVPWAALFLSPEGRWKPCCNSALDLGAAVPGEMSDQIEPLWNSEPMRDLRRRFLRGEQPESCRNCFRREELGGTSHRIAANATLERFDPPLFAATRETLQEVCDPHLVRLDFAMGNVCDLKCRMCGPAASSSWIQEEALEGRPVPAIWRASAEDLGAVAGRRDELRYLSLQGGEPLLSPHFIPFLETLIADGRARKLELAVTTNGRHLTPEHVALFDRFKATFVTMSVDGPAGVHDYVRGSEFSRIERALDCLRSSSANLTINFSLSALNVLSVPEFLHWFDGVRGARLRVGVVHAPRSLEITRVPRDVLARLSADLERHPSAYKTPFLEILARAVPAANATLGDDLVAHVRRLDRRRGQDIRASVPALAALFPS